ncbi:hypothetical protein QWY93_19120 [Echinicola jeungdonensis]|nr:hypothetical protein [Echinicola jeungdonensis]MDN3671373.1 hypothetical protein [Echinicola jeungdonensis]
MEKQVLKLEENLGLDQTWSGVGPGNLKQVNPAASRKRETASNRRRERNPCLEKSLKEAELERDILKKAVSIFSKGDNKYSGS